LYGHWATGLASLSYVTKQLQKVQHRKMQGKNENLVRIEMYALTFICPRIANMIPNYSQQDATFLDLFISTDAVKVSGVSSIDNQYCCLLLSWMRRQQPVAVLVDNT
jgi:hypothetical protein